MLVLGLVRLLVRVRMIVPMPASMPVVIIVPVRVRMPALPPVAVAVRPVPRFARMIVIMPVLVIMRVIVLMIMRVIVIVPITVIVLPTHHGLPSPAFAFGSFKMR
jgi:hypothetical protein